MWDTLHLQSHLVFYNKHLFFQVSVCNKWSCSMPGVLSGRGKQIATLLLDVWYSRSALC